jgi:hypothetical protein
MPAVYGAFANGRLPTSATAAISARDNIGALLFALSRFFAPLIFALPVS